MYFVSDSRMLVNRFTDVKLPTKAQIFSRTGGKAVTPNGVYTKDEAAVFGKTSTESAMEFVNAADSYSPPKEDLPE